MINAELYGKPAVVSDGLLSAQKHNEIEFGGELGLEPPWPCGPSLALKLPASRACGALALDSIGAEGIRAVHQR